VLATLESSGSLSGVKESASLCKLAAAIEGRMEKLALEDGQKEQLGKMAQRIAHHAENTNPLNHVEWMLRSLVSLRGNITSCCDKKVGELQRIIHSNILWSVPLSSGEKLRKTLAKARMMRTRLGNY
jgi:hypothetical protein